MKKEKNTFWDKIFKQDILLQANVVEMIGWAGLVIFIGLIYIFWTARIDLTIPVKEPQWVKAGVIKANVSKDYARQLVIGQEAVIAVISDGQGHRIKGNIIEVNFDKGFDFVSVLIKSFESGKKEEIKNVRILLKGKLLRGLFIRKEFISDVL